MPPTKDDTAALREELEAIPRGERLDYLARLPAERQARFKRFLSRDDIQKLNRRINLLERQRRKPSVESWLADARAGKASTPEAMIEVLGEVRGRMRPKDAEWIRRISDTAAAVGYSKRQQEVIRAIYARYFVHGSES